MIRVVNVDPLSVVCGFRGVPAPTVSMEGVAIDGGLLSVIYHHPPDDVDCYHQSTATLVWGTEDEDDRRGAGGTVTCLGMNPLDSQPLVQEFYVDVQCKYNVIDVSFIYLPIYIAHLPQFNAQIRCAGYEMGRQGHTGQPSVREIEASTMYNKRVTITDRSL